MNKKPNLILITFEALRADHLGFMGYKKNISPNINALAKKSTVFTHAYSLGPVSLHSLPSILTSTYPLDYQGPRKIERPRVLISEVLKKEGYITAAFQPSGYLSKYLGNNDKYYKGWDFFENIILPDAFRQIKEKNKKTVKLNLKNFFTKLYKGLTFSFCPRAFFKIEYLKYKRRCKKQYSKMPQPKIKSVFVNPVIKSFIYLVKKRKKPFFIWIHYMDLHTPYFSYRNLAQNELLSYSEFVSGQLPGRLAEYSEKVLKIFVIFKKFAKKNLKETTKLYDQSIKYIDQQIGNLIEFLKKENIYQNSIICLSADHGEEFWEHGGSSHSPKLYNELLHVPLLFKIPGGNPKVLENKVSLIDLSPTICDLVGVKKDSSFKGKNLFIPSNSPIFHQTARGIEKFNNSKVACQLNNWKYIFNRDTQTEELYNLSQDSKEQKNLSQPELKILSRMRKIIKKFEKENPPFSLVEKI